MPSLLESECLLNVEELVHNNGKDHFYTMHLSYEGHEWKRLWDYARENGFIGLSHPFITEDWNKDRDYSIKALSRTWVKQFDMFCNEMQAGDILLVLRGWDSLLGIAEVTGPEYNFDSCLSGDNCEPFFDHVRKVKWHKTYSHDNPLKLPEPVKGFVNSLSKVKPDTQRWSLLANITI